MSRYSPPRRLRGSRQTRETRDQPGGRPDVDSVNQTGVIHMERVNVVPEPLQAAAATPVHERPAEPVRSASDSADEPAPAVEPHTTAEPGVAGTGRFQIFIIDTGWHSVARKVLNENLALLRDLLREDPIYVLDRESSVQAMRRYNHLIGRDPLITVVDTRAAKHRGGQPHGFHLSLGLLREEGGVLQALQSFSRFLASHRDCADIDAVVRQKFRREGIAGAMTIVLSGGESAEKILTAM